MDDPRFSAVCVQDVAPQYIRDRPLEQFVDGLYCDQCNIGFVSEAILEDGWGQYRQA
jgi:hypothetical protein